MRKSTPTPFILLFDFGIYYSNFGSEKICTNNFRRWLSLCFQAIRQIWVEAIWQYRTNSCGQIETKITFNVLRTHKFKSYVCSCVRVCTCVWWTCNELIIPFYCYYKLRTISTGEHCRWCFPIKCMTRTVCANVFRLTKCSFLLTEYVSLFLSLRFYYSRKLVNRINVTADTSFKQIDANVTSVCIEYRATISISITKYLTIYICLFKYYYRRIRARFGFPLIPAAVRENAWPRQTNASQFLIQNQ